MSALSIHRSSADTFEAGSGRDWDATTTDDDEAPLPSFDALLVDPFCRRNDGALAYLLFLIFLVGDVELDEAEGELGEAAAPERWRFFCGESKSPITRLSMLGDGGSDGH